MDPTKSLLHLECFNFAIHCYSSDLFSRKKSAFPKRKLSLYSTVWVNFSKLSIKPTKYRRFHYSNLYLCFALKRTRFASSPSKSLNITVINSFLQKLSTWVTAKSNISTKIDFLLLTSRAFFRVITMCSTFTLIVGLTITLLFSLKTCIVQIQNVWVKFACTKRLFNLLAEAIIKVRNVGLCARCAIFLLKIKQTPFLVAWSKGLLF